MIESSKMTAEGMEAMPKLIVFTDIGDTVIDEGTEIRAEPGGTVLRADCIPGAKETMLELYERGYTLVMVADGLVKSFENTLRQNGLNHIFRARAVSEEVGVCKPDPRMFKAAFDRAGLCEADRSRVVMVGNHIVKDVGGANRFGIRSVHLHWSPRHPNEPSCPEEIPDYVIHTPAELLPLVERLNAELENA